MMSADRIIDVATVIAVTVIVSGFLLGIFLGFYRYANDPDIREEAESCHWDVTLRGYDCPQIPR